LADDLIVEHPDGILAWGLLGEVHLARDDLEAAAAAYRHMGERGPHRRAYLLAMLALHQAQDDYVTASGYAARLQRTVEEGESLPATTLRRLRDYYRVSGETNRADDVQAALRTLYNNELSALQAAFVDEPKIVTRRPSRPMPAAETERITPLPEPLPIEQTAPVSDQERQRLEQATQEFFGYQSLLPGQAETMITALRNQDVLTVLPTGGGKSLCYQLLALLEKEGTTLVISPLIALMKDQVDSLPNQVRRRATTINSSLEGRELYHRMQGVTAGRYRLVYAAPERLRQTPFLHALRRAGVKRLVIDEAHCISVWGHDFRPDYLRIAQAREELGNPPVLAMTATAPPRVRRDILHRLGGTRAKADSETLEHPHKMALVATDTYRPNLYLAAVRAQNADDKLRHLLALVASERGSGIIYAGTRDRCERIAALLRDRGISAGHYHAGIGDRNARAAAQDSFMSGQVRVMVATIAFGMGIDRADIRFIIHLQLPPSLEAYYQEVGRAGRDGLPAHCVLIYSTSDRATLTRRAKRDALTAHFLRNVYRAVNYRLGDAKLGRVATGDLMRDLKTEDTAVRVAICTLEEAGLLRRHHDLPRTAVVRVIDGRAGEAPDQPDAAYSDFISAARLRPGQPLPIDLIAVAQNAGLDPTTIESALLKWVDAGWLEYRPAGRELLLELLPPPSDACARVEALIDRYATIQKQRVDEIATYAATRRCRHGHISAYLSGQPIHQCPSCDNCQTDTSPIKRTVPALDLPNEEEQLQTILRCVANSPGGWGRANLTYILRGSQRAWEHTRKSPQWAALAFRSRTAVENMIDRLIAADLLRARELDHGGIVLNITAAGHAAIRDASWLQPLVADSSAEPSITPTGNETNNPMDEDLFERLRGWRKETSQAAGVPPYVVAHDSLLRRIATACPQDEVQLAELKGIGPKKLAQYGAAILAITREKHQP
jgi:ATP-dependent DNA helicase RecQ